MGANVSSNLSTFTLKAPQSDVSNVSVIVVTESAFKKLKGQVDGAQEITPSNHFNAEGSHSQLQSEEIDRVNAFWQRRLFMYTSQNKLLEEKLQMLDKIDLPGVNVGLVEKYADSRQLSSSSLLDEKLLEQCYTENLKQPLKCNLQFRNFLRRVNEHT